MVFLDWQFIQVLQGLICIIIGKFKDQMELGTLLILLASVSIIYFMFSHVNSRPGYFLLGVTLCLIIETILLAFYSLFKLQKAYRFSKSIQIKRNSEINPEVEYPFQKYQESDNFYYNKYTEEARLFARKKQLKMAETQNGLVNDYYRPQESLEETEADGKIRKSIMIFLKELRGYHNTLNHFNNTLVFFGKKIKKIDDQGLIVKKNYFFSEFQMNFPSEVPLNQLTNDQRQVLLTTKTKLKIRKDKQRLLFPNWKLSINAFKAIGEEYQKIEMMRQSNSQMLEMIHKKVLEDYELLQNKIEDLKKSLEQIKSNKYQLNKDYKKYQAQQINENTTNEPHVEMRYWVKRKIYEFRDLQRRIRENERDETNHNRKLKYYKEKLSSFLEQNRLKYYKILRTQFISFSDSYYITVDQSIKRLQTIFTANHNYETPKPPKVKKLPVTKNMNDTLAYENNYQKQYFERVRFYERKLDSFIQSLQSLGSFLEKLEEIWKTMIESLTKCVKKGKSTKIFAKFFKQLIFKSHTLEKQISQLKQINEIVKKSNLSQLQQMQSKIKLKMTASINLLSSIVVDNVPIQYRYQFVKNQLQGNYRQLQEIIQKIKQFQELYMIHSSRIKKILLVELISYLNFQRYELIHGDISNYVNPHNQNTYGNYNNNNTTPNLNSNPNTSTPNDHNTDGEYDLMIEEYRIPEEMNQQNKEIIMDEALEKPDSLQTGFGLSRDHIKLLNQFLFVAYTQWKQSQFFKKTLSEELYIIFNSEPNENFSNVEVDSMFFSGAPPQIVSIKELRSEEHELFIDVHLAFKGKWELNMKTLLKIFRSNWNVSIKANFEAFYCVMRLCFVPTKIGRGKSWFSFIGEPIAKIDISLKIWDLISFEQEPVKNLFANFLNNKMKKFIYPVKQSINIPVSKKTDQLLKIQRRLKSLSQQF